MVKFESCANQFVTRHGLSGFYTGMFISEKMESLVCGVIGVDQSDIDESNHLFSEVLSRFINEDNETIYKNLLEGYRKIGEKNPVMKYNHHRLYNL